MKTSILAVVAVSIVVSGATGCGCSGTGIVGDGIGDPSPVDAMDPPWTDVPGPDMLDVHEIPGGDVPTAGDATWEPPIDGMGEPGWRDSVEPFCREDMSFYLEMDLWSDHRGVFVTVASMGMPDGGSLIFNGGTGWSELLSADPMIPEDGGFIYVKGVPGGPVFLWGIMPTMTTYIPESGAASTDWIHITDIHAVSGSLAYAVTGEGPRLLRYDGSSWGPFPGDPVPYPTHRVWADESSIFCAGDTGIVLSWEDDRWTVHDTRTIDSVISIWGFSPDDVWAGTSNGRLLHYDGSAWERMAWPDMGDGADECRPPGDGIMGMWGRDGVLFFHTSRELVMWDGAGFTVLGYWPGVYGPFSGGWYCRGQVIIRAIWGNAVDELFLAVEESDVDTDLCEEYLMWWDGSAFHWF